MKNRLFGLSVLMLALTAFAPAAFAQKAIVSAANGGNAAEPGTNGAFNVAIDKARAFDTVVTYVVEAGSTATAGSDYTALTGSVTVLAGETPTATINVNVIDDALVEGNETVIIHLVSTDSASVDVDPTPAVVNIVDNDATLTVIKHVDGGSANASNWTMEVTNTIPAQNASFPGAESPGTDVVIAAGTYSVNESGGPGGGEVYNMTLGAGCSGSITAGGTASCTITNTFVPPTTTTTTTTTTSTTAPTTTTTAAPTTTTTAGSTTTTTAGPTTTTTAGPTTTTTAGSTTTTTAGPTTTTTAGSTTTTTAGSTTTTTAGSTTTTTAAPTTTTTAVATTTTTTTTAPTTTTTLPAGTPQLTLVKTADPSTFDAQGVTINYTYLVSSTGTAPVIGPITVTDSRMTVTCPPVNTVGNNDDNLDPGESLICTSSLVTTEADVSLGYILTSSVAQGANVSSAPVEISVPLIFVGIPTLTEWSMIMLSFLFMMMGVIHLRRRQKI